MKSNLVDLEVALHHQTEKGLKVSLDGNPKKAVWLPKEAVEVNDEGRVVIITLPEQLAIDKGLV